MSIDEFDQDDSLGPLALGAFAVGGAMLLWNMFSSSNEETTPKEVSHFTGMADAFQLAQTFAEQGKYNEAIQMAIKAIEVNPTDPNPHNLIAWIFAINNVYFDQAQLEAEKAIELALDPSILANCHDTLAEVYARTGQIEDAIHHFRESLKLAPNGDQVYKDFSPSFRLALCYIGQSNLNNGGYYLNQALQIAPQNPSIYQAVGGYCFQINRYMEAIQHYHTALHLAQNWMNFRYPLMGNFNVDEDRRFFQCLCWTGIGATYFALKDYKSSRVANENACELYGFLPHSWINLAILAACNKDEPLMRHCLEKSLLLNPHQDRDLLDYLLITRDFGEYRPIVLGLLRSHNLISSSVYQSSLSSTPQGNASPVVSPIPIVIGTGQIYMGGNNSIGDISNSTVGGIGQGTNNQV